MMYIHIAHCYVFTGVFVPDNLYLFSEGKLKNRKIKVKY